MFLDTAVIYCKAGNGGDGLVSFHREKYIQYGGPDGGDGGSGGDIIFVGDSSINTLSAFRYTQHFHANNGDKGSKKNMKGRTGSPVVIKVPRGTIIKDFETGGILADIFEEGKQITILKGGRGGAGNAKFATPTRRSPGFCELGEKTLERKIKLEIKTIADVGLVGFPNAGKSTILSAISAARPKIGDYPFTTLVPNLGVVDIDDYSYVVADIPGLIEGASDGAGLGHMFLRHIERVRLICHVIDINDNSERTPIKNYKIIRHELEKYSEKLAVLPEIIVINKIDLGVDQSIVDEISKETKSDLIQISAATMEGILELKRKIAKKLQQLPPIKEFDFVHFEYEKRDKSEFIITKEADASFRLSGGMIEEYARKVVLNNEESFRWFQHSLRERGVISKLKEEGLVDGSIVKILDIEFTYTE
ncbi:MAG: GTPase ObgE [Christensenellaceae bacterium]|jgi:GTP-binding protein|nr:GTPase ObgE [Christensenellaceae bacterium]